MTWIDGSHPGEIQVPNAPTQILAISKDGRRIVYGGSRLYRRLLSEREAIPIGGTEATLGSTSQPVFSPDGASIAFVTGSPGRVVTRENRSRPGEQSFQGQRMLPDGKTLILYAVPSTWRPSRSVNDQCRSFRE